jgi:hypothetical protein
LSNSNSSNQTPREYKKRLARAEAELQGLLDLTVELSSLGMQLNSEEIGRWNTLNGTGTRSIAHYQRRIDELSAENFEE